MRDELDDVGALPDVGIRTLVKMQKAAAEKSKGQNGKRRLSNNLKLSRSRGSLSRTSLSRNSLSRTSLSKDQSMSSLMSQAKKNAHIPISFDMLQMEKGKRKMTIMAGKLKEKLGIQKFVKVTTHTHTNFLLRNVFSSMFCFFHY